MRGSGLRWFSAMVLAALAAVASLCADPPGHLPTRHFGFPEGLTNLSVLTLAQGADGLVYAGTEAGLFRFDGRRFEDVLVNAENKFITCLLTGPDGRLWVGTRNGLGYLDRTGAFHLQADLPSERIDSLGCDGQDRIWIVEGARIWVGSGGSFRAVAGPAGDTLVTIFADPGLPEPLALGQKGIWARAGEGWMATPSRLPSPSPLAFGRDGTGWLWLRTAKGCYRMAPGGAWSPMPELGGTIPDHLAMTRDREGWLWIHTAEGMYRCRGERVVPIHAAPRGQVPITALVDREGSPWLAAVGVIQVLGRGAWSIQGNAEGLPSEVVWATARDGQGRLWAATDAGLALASAGGWKVVRKGQFSRVQRHPDGSMLAVGSPGGTLFRVDPGTLKVEASRAECLPATPVSRGLGVDAEGAVYISDFNNGIARGLRRNGAWVWEPLRLEGLDAGRLFEVVQDSRGNVFLPTRDKVWLRAGGGWESLGEVLPLTPLAAAREPGGDVWVTYLDKPVLTRHHRTAGGWQCVDQWWPFPRRERVVIFSLACTDQGRIWAGTSQGLGLLDPAGRRSVAWIAPGEGIPGADATTQGLRLDADGTLWYGTTEGVGRYRPAPGAQALAPHLPALLGWSALPRAKGLPVLAPGGVLDGHFASPTLCSPSTATLEARLAGVDPDWVRLDDYRVRYAALPHGDYRLEVRALQDGVPGPETLALAFRVLPHPWETWWARLLGLLAAALGVSGLVVRRSWALRRHNEELRRMVEQRTLELRETNLQLEQASRAKSMFLASMSHELRTPLNAILLYSQLLLDGAVARGDAEGCLDLERIRSAGQHLLGMINGVLDLAKIEAGMMETTNLEDVPVAILLAEVEDTLRPLAAARGNRLEIRVAPGVGEFRTDLTKLRQVLINLGGNACKFTEGGWVALSAAAEGGGLKLQVRDNGKGMSAEQVRRVFDAFEQGSEEVTRNYGGTGLGLTISRHLVHLLQGTLEAESAPGEGTCFTILLPELPLPAPTGVS